MPSFLFQKISKNFHSKKCRSSFRTYRILTGMTRIQAIVHSLVSPHLLQARVCSLQELGAGTRPVEECVGRGPTAALEARPLVYLSQLHSKQPTRAYFTLRVPIAKRSCREADKRMKTDSFGRDRHIFLNGNVSRCLCHSSILKKRNSPHFL